MTSPPDDLTQQMQQLAERHVLSAQSWYGLTFDYSPLSLQLVDFAIDAFHPEAGRSASVVAAHGAYVGEVIRRHIGGDWTTVDPQTPPHLAAVAKRAVHPFDWARRRFHDLERPPLADAFDLLLQDLGRPVPDQFGSTTAILAYGLRSCTGAASPTLLTQPPDQLRLLAPLIAFSLVSSVNGKITRRELRELHRQFRHPDEFTSPQFRMTLADLQPQLATHSAAIQAESVATKLLALGQLRDWLDQQYPDSATAFATDLLHLARSIACASAGWRGFFRSRIDTNSASMLQAIKSMLRLEDESKAEPSSKSLSSDVFHHSKNCVREPDAHDR
ncbi:MAG: hypothetical protein KDA58_16305 [Planctomycetaceae bacterium]|nr:hypothetical protein [Planctomycetaceae bacterium]